MKKFGKIMGVIILCLVAIIGGYAMYLQATYYRIADHQSLVVKNPQKRELMAGKSYTATTYNVGFGAYNQRYSFFMDTGETKDGHHTRGKYGTAVSKQAEIQSTNYALKVIKKQHPDFALFQEIDTNSTRSFHVNQVQRAKQLFPNLASTFALNFHSGYLAVPLNNPHGKVRSGLLTLTGYQIKNAERRQYPVSSHFIEKFVDHY